MRGSILEIPRNKNQSQAQKKKKKGFKGNTKFILAHGNFTFLLSVALGVADKDEI